MLGASAESLRKAPGLSSYRPPRDKPGAGTLGSGPSAVRLTLSDSAELSLC